MLFSLLQQSKTFLGKLKNKKALKDHQKRSSNNSGRYIFVCKWKGGGGTRKNTKGTGREGRKIALKDFETKGSGMIPR